MFPLKGRHRNLSTEVMTRLLKATKICTYILVISARMYNYNHLEPSGGFASVAYLIEIRCRTSRYIAQGSYDPTQLSGVTKLQARGGSTSAVASIEGRYRNLSTEAMTRLLKATIYTITTTSNPVVALLVQLT
ncbi:hypothetical protein ACOSP7_021976 [Xanthoceras sorbifolium]